MEAKRETNKILSLLVGLFLVFTLAPSVSAQDELNRGPGAIGPDNGFLYGIDISWDNVRYAFATQDNKVNVGLEIAEERLAEINNSESREAIERAERNREKIMERLQERDNSEGEEEQIRQRLQKHVRVLEQIRERSPEQSQQGIDTAIGNSERGLERLRNGMENRPASASISFN